MIGVYAITDHKGKTYIGSSVNIHDRWRNHADELDRGVHHSYRLQAAWNKYGKSVFTFSLIEAVNEVDDLTATEQKWIDGAKPYYNIKRVAHRPKMTAEEKSRIAEFRMKQDIKRHNEFIENVAYCERMLRIGQLFPNSCAPTAELTRKFKLIYDKAIRGQWPLGAGMEGPRRVYRWQLFEAIVSTDWFPRNYVRLVKLGKVVLNAGQREHMEAIIGMSDEDIYWQVVDREGLGMRYQSEYANNAA